jgi:hypothetical protein
MKPRVRLLASGLLALALVAAACAPDGSPSTGSEELPDEPAATPSATGTSEVPDPSEGEVVLVPPDIDTTQHSVALSDVHFDTFDGSSVPLDESTPELRAALLDAIPPIDRPVYGKSDRGDWMAPDDLVLGYVAGNQAYAYPFKILNFHEIVNDELDGVPVLISYCPLCRSAIVYDRRVAGELLSFGNTSALFDSDLVMVDRSTGSYWWQVAGEAIVGPLTGTRLTLLPSAVSTWSGWVGDHPETLVLTRDTGFDRPYERDVFSSYPAAIDAGQFPFPAGVAARDERLPASTLVVALTVGDTTRAYVTDGFAGPVNDVIDGRPVVLLPTDGGAMTFSPVVNDTTLVFKVGTAGITDEQTGSVWTDDGLAASGPMEGSRLTPVPSRTTFWFAIVAAFPDAEIADR